MIEKMQMRLWQFSETWQQKGLKAALAKTIYIHAVIVPTRKKLDTVTSKRDVLKQKELSFVQISPEISPATHLVYPLQSRQIKKTINATKGYWNFAMISGNEVIGDVWCALPGTAHQPHVHPDVPELGIQMGEKDAYLFDAYIKPDQRGKALVAPFMLTCLAALKERGCEYSYGFYELNNTPALWMHRLLKYEELPRRRVTNLVFYRTSGPIRRESEAPVRKPATEGEKHTGKLSVAD